MKPKLCARDIAQAMDGFGKLTNRQIYMAVANYSFYHKIKLSRHWKSTVRNTMQRHCLKNPKFREPALFVHHGHGVWEHKRRHR